MEELKIPRFLKPSNMNGDLTYELHHFCDASGEAYGAVSYLRIADKSGKVHCSFLMGKPFCVCSGSFSIIRRMVPKGLRLQSLLRPST